MSKLKPMFKTDNVDWYANKLFGSKRKKKR